MIDNILSNSLFFGMAISLGTYALGALFKKKIKFMNPQIFSIITIIAVIKIFNISYETYDNGAKYLSYLLTPVTVVLAIPLYRQLKVLKDNAFEILISILAGVLSSLGGVLALSYAFGLNHSEYVTLLPKSITTAIGMSISAELGGYENITIGVILITGIIGNVFAELLLKLMRIKHPVAKGLAIGTSAHAFGTVKALEIGEVEGAMSSLSIAVSGLMTVVFASFFAGLI